MHTPRPTPNAFAREPVEMRAPLAAYQFTVWQQSDKATFSLNCWGCSSAVQAPAYIYTYNFSQLVHTTNIGGDQIYTEMLYKIFFVSKENEIFQVFSLRILPLVMHADYDT